MPQTAGWNWEHLFALATAEAVLPTLSAAVHDGVDIGAPPDISDFLAGVIALSRERNHNIWQELIAAVRLLNEAGIEPVLLKGAAYLATDLYGDFGSRYLSDLDLLVTEDQFPAAIKILFDNGYTRNEWTPFAEFRYHYAPLSRGSAWIEVHHAIGPPKCCLILPSQSILKEAKLVEVEGVRFRIPAPTHLVTHVIAHSQIAGSYEERIWPQLRAMYDLARLQNRYGVAIDWPEVLKAFTGEGESGTLKLFLLDVQEALGLQTPIHLNLTPDAKIRHWRRHLLRNFPLLRYFDPIYMLSILFRRRLQVLRTLLTRPGGIKHLCSHIFAPTLWTHFLSDLREGRGR